jgi:hypothetical protein
MQLGLSSFQLRGPPLEQGKLHGCERSLNLSRKALGLKLLATALWLLHLPARGDLVGRSHFG